MLNLYLCPNLTSLCAASVLQPPVSSVSFITHLWPGQGKHMGCLGAHILSQHVWGHLCAAGGGQEA